MPLYPPVRLQPSRIQGTGLFAGAEIAEGAVIWRPGAPFLPYHVDVISTWPPERQARFFKYSIQSADDWHTGDPEASVEAEPFAHTNHSCDPNTWWLEDMTLVARRPIRPGEEITFDYASTEIREGFGLGPCACGSPLCRKVITNSDFREHKSLQERYGNHVLPHVLKAAHLSQHSG